MVVIAAVRYGIYPDLDRETVGRLACKLCYCEYGGMRMDENAKGESIGYCYSEKDCKGNKVSNSKITKKVCKDLDGKSWKNSDTDKCENL